MLDPGHVSPGSKNAIDFGNSPVAKKLRLAKRDALKTYACSYAENHSIRTLGEFVAAEVRKGTPAYWKRKKKSSNLIKKKLSIMQETYTCTKTYVMKHS